MTDIVQRTEAALDGITPWPWELDDSEPGEQSVYARVNGRQVPIGTAEGFVAAEFDAADAEFIAGAPERECELLAEVKRLRPAPCDMKHNETYDFAWCETHDTTFALGDKCKFDGREPWEVFAAEAYEQRQLKVRAEIERDALRARVAAVRALVVWSDPERCGGLPCVRGTRVFVDTITNLFEDKGITDEMIVALYPTVIIEQVALLRALDSESCADWTQSP